ncbi:Dolichyl-phosphate-mannose mannosyltransferase 2 [Fusarium coicis]|nr:Dolichyl-phosphate-mannose mannosyltransferase 2 [Fusarium coicis]
MIRTVTRNQDKLFIPPGGIDFSSQANKPGVVDIYLRAGDNTPGTGLHWHENHTEYLQVVQGYALVTVGDRTAVFSKDDRIITIPRYTIHQYMRADKTDEGKAGKDVDLIVREWTEPGDGDKEVFFRNMISLIIDKKDGALGTMGMLLSVITVCWSHDNYPVFLEGTRGLWGGCATKIPFKIILVFTALNLGKAYPCAVDSFTQALAGSTVPRTNIVKP